MLLTTFQRQRDLAKAINETEKEAVLWGQSPENAARQIAPLRKAYADLGAKGSWQNLLVLLETDSPKGHSDPYAATVVLARVGDKDRALAVLEKSCEARSKELL